ncbi:hypothetical protein DV735_g4713, partial [Chaetothyriales sp. CBS 134920]
MSGKKGKAQASSAHPNVVVALRNLGKKDSTTKSKAIEELQAHVRATPSVDEAVIAAWIALYHRASIDTSRRVRQLAHTLQGSITLATTKRILPYLGSAIGPWLAGLFDNDRVVERAAKEALELAFAAPEKRHMLWKKYTDSLLNHAEDAILIQTVGSLSDERSTSKDEAEAKYSRVVGSAMLLVTHLIQVHERDHAAREIAEKLEPMIANKRLWEFASSADPYLRKSTYTLVVACAQNFAAEIDWSVISSSFLSKGLSTDQLGSSGPYIDALLALTRIHPTIWTSDYHAKQSVAKKLIKFLSKGSQHGPERFWRCVDELVKILPGESLTSSGTRFVLDDAISIATALREGLGSQEEPRQNLSAAWTCYIDLCFWLQEQLDESQTQESFLRSHLLPVVTTYVDPTSSTVSLPPASSLELAASVMLRIAKYGLDSLFADTWSNLGDSLVTKMKLSLPASSKDFESSQNAIVNQSSRLQRLRQRLLDWMPSEIASAITLSLTNSQTILVREAIDLLKNRNGKPYGAATVLLGIFDNQESSTDVKEFLTEYLPNLLESPSSPLLVQLWQKLDMDMSSLLKDLSNQPKLNEYGQKSLAVLLASASLDQLNNVPLVEQLKAGPSNVSISADDHPLVVSLLLNPTVAETGLISNLSDAILKDLAIDVPPEQRLQTLGLVDSLTGNPATKPKITAQTSANELRTRLILLSDSDDTATSSKASEILSRLQPSTWTGVKKGVESDTLIRDQLHGAQPQLPILSLVDLALSEVTKSDEASHALGSIDEASHASGSIDEASHASGSIDEASHALGSILPSAEDWKAAIEPFLASSVPASLGITSPLQGAIYAVTSTPVKTVEVTKDSEGLSQLFRLTLYTARLLGKFPEKVRQPDIIAILWQYLPGALHFFNEKLTLDSINALWADSTPELIDEAVHVLSQGNALIQQIVAELPPEQFSITFLHRESSRDYHTASIGFDRLSRLITRDGAANVFAQWESDVESQHRGPLNKSDDLLQSAVITSTLREALSASKRGKRLLNDLISDATDAKSLDLSIQTLRPLSLLNILLSDGGESLEAVQSQRLVFLMQNLVKLLQEPEKESYVVSAKESNVVPAKESYVVPAKESTVSAKESLVVSEVLKLLANISQANEDIYGDHWQQMLGYVADLWEQDLQLPDDLPLLHSSLRLYQKLKTLASGKDANEDLVDAWTATKAPLTDGLLNCLQAFKQPDGGINQPRQVTASLLGRLLATEDVDDVLSLYPLMSSDEDTILETAYSLLHRAIPRLQEELSLQILLEKSTAELPPELLQVLADGPPPSGLILETKRYLLSWHLLFDHFTSASYKLREAYVASLKAANILPILLDTVCALIRITDSRPVDASKFAISTFTLSSSADEDQVQHLSIHLYYLGLLYVPSLAKSWFIEQKNRIRTPLESWTQKHISPLIVTATFSSVASWVSTQKSEDESDLNLEVKFSHAARDLTASIAVDPESPPIALTISLPAAFPLASPTLSSQTRVAVSERTWQSWLRTFQIVIFSTNSIIEGLVAFRRNVAGAIKGQGECAICYSVIGSDMQTPNKKCSVCKNVFHGGCLYRWFRSSNASTCPLCRNNFNFG